MYSIVREPLYDSHLEELFTKYDRMKDLDNAIEWALSRKPSSIPDSVHIEDNFYIWTTEEFSTGIPTVRIVYRVDEDTKTVSLKAISEISEEDLML